MDKAKRIKHISETICNLCDEAYNEGFEAGTKSVQECSWERGVRDAWEYIKHKSDELLGEDEVPSQLWGFIRVLHDLDPVIYTKGFVEERNKEDLTKTEPIKKGDVVADGHGEECVVLYVNSITDCAYVMNKDESVHYWSVKGLTKTGKKALIDVNKVLGDGELK